MLDQKPTENIVETCRETKSLLLIIDGCGSELLRSLDGPDERWCGPDEDLNSLASKASLLARLIKTLRYH